MATSMRIEAARRLPVRRERVFDLIMSPHVWTAWHRGLAGVEGDQTVTWVQAGDHVGFVYDVGGRTMAGRATLDEIDPARYVRFRVVEAALGAFDCEWFFSDVGETASSLRFVCEPDAGADGSALAHLVQAELRSAMRNLEAVLTADRLERRPLSINSI